VDLPMTESGAAGFAALLRRPTEALLAFDFDGTLSPIVDDPGRARPLPRTITALGRLATRVGGIAIITGRPASAVVDLAGLESLPQLADLVVFGHYGRERWDARSRVITAPPLPPGVASARVDLPRLLELLGASSATIEDKTSSLAVHTRQTADPNGILDRLRQPLRDFAEAHDLIVEPGRFVLELRPPGVDKGSVLRDHVADHKASVVVYAGDDLGDLAAFAAIDALRADGLAGVKICSGSAEAAPEVAQRADLVVDGPTGLADLLEDLLTTLT
jgi:trehalose 6-phosphate phosphatase